MLKRQINATEPQINNLVFVLYGLTDEEIAIVESAGKFPMIYLCMII
jgi:hypothetical protein